MRTPKVGEIVRWWVEGGILVSGEVAEVNEQDRRARIECDDGESDWISFSWIEWDGATIKRDRLSQEADDGEGPEVEAVLAVHATDAACIEAGQIDEEGWCRGCGCHVDEDMLFASKVARGEVPADEVRRYVERQRKARGVPPGR